MIQINSSAISAVKYNSATHTLKIWFTSSGRGYDYYSVPAHIYEGLLRAPSKGNYFNHYIRDQYAA
jgi:KTSC domain